MSTKINVRSPFYLNLTEPVESTPTFTCALANIQNLQIDMQGQILEPQLEYGQVLSITSTDAAYSNGKFTVTTTGASRNLTVRIAIPDGFTNSDAGYIDCDQVVQQPAFVSGTTCTGGVTASGTIPNQTLDINGDSASINLSSYFSGGSGTVSYTISTGQDPSLLGTSVSGTTFTVTSNNRAGSTYVQISAKDSVSGSCTATQSFQVTVNAAVGVTFTCSDALFSGGSIAQDGTLTDPNTPATIDETRSTSGGAAISSYSANNTGSDRQVTLYYNLIVPDGYTNAGNEIECSRQYTQPSVLPTFTCDNANLYGQQISTKGIINEGYASQGTIKSWSPNTRQPEVTVDTPRVITFTITVPNQSSVWANANQDITCDVTITQPRSIQTCGANTYYITAPVRDYKDFCNDRYYASSAVKGFGTTISTNLDKQICKSGTPMNGNSFYYGVATARQYVGKGTGTFQIWEIDSEGYVRSVKRGNCPKTGDVSDRNFGDE